MDKIFIVSTDKYNKNKYILAEYLSNVFDLSIANTIVYTNNTSILDNYKYLSILDLNNILLAYKNNALLYAITYADKDDNNTIETITIDDYYNNDIFCLSIEAFNNICENKLVNCIVIWIDSNLKQNNISFNEISHFEESLKDIPYLYFNENINHVCQIVYKYFSGNKDEKQKILEENS